MDLEELRRIRKLRRQLQFPAYLFERFGGGCSGECEHPVNITQAINGVHMTCCNLRPSFERYHELRGMERWMLENEREQSKAG